MFLETVRALKDEARASLEGMAPPDEPGAPPDIDLGIGIREPGDFRLAVRIRTLEPRPELQAAILQRLTQVTDARDIDLQYTGRVFALPGDTEQADQLEQIVIGSSVSHYLTRGGTLGFFAFSLDNGDHGLVSANHVIGELDAASEGDPIVHPWNGQPPDATVATFVRSAKLGGGGNKHVDASFAKLVTADYDASALPGGKKLDPQIAAPEESTSVFKFGAATGLRAGTVLSFDWDKFQVRNYRNRFGVVQFVDQIEIESADRTYAFARKGDSGALVYNDRFRAVGLLFGMTLAGGKYDNGLFYANPMQFVLDELKVGLLT